MNCPNINQVESDHLFRMFCSYFCLLTNKKYNLANILLLYLQNKDVRELFRSILDIDDDISAIRAFLEFDPSLYKSKYIMKFLNSPKAKNILK